MMQDMQHGTPVDLARHRDKFRYDEILKRAHFLGVVKLPNQSAPSISSSITCVQTKKKKEIMRRNVKRSKQLIVGNFLMWTAQCATVDRFPRVTAACQELQAALDMEVEEEPATREARIAPLRLPIEKFWRTGLAAGDINP